MAPTSPSRSASAAVVLRDGVPLVWFDRRSHHLVRFPESEVDDGWAAALAGLAAVGARRGVEVRKVDGGGVPDVVAEVLRAAGFVDGYRGLVLRR